MSSAHYLVLQVPNWHAQPNGMALVRVYDDAPDERWFGIVADSTGTRLPYPPNATIIADDGRIADTDADGQRESEINAIRAYEPPQRDVHAEEGGIDPAGSSSACQCGESYAELARRIGAVLWNELTDSGDLEDRSWIHLTASTDLRDSAVTQQQRTTLDDLSERGDGIWQRFMQRVIATLHDADAWERNERPRTRITPDGNLGRWMDTQRPAISAPDRGPLCVCSAHQQRTSSRYTHGASLHRKFVVSVTKDF